MPEARLLPAERLVEQDVLRRRRDPLFGADDIGDAHEVIVDDVGQVVGGEAVAFEQDLVVDVGVVEGDVAAQFVAEGGAGLLRDLEPNGVGFAGGELGVDLLGGEIAGMAAVFGRLFGGHLCFALGFELFGGLEGVVGGAVGEQDLGMPAVDVSALGLAVWAVRATDVGAFIPREADPAQRVKDHLLGGGHEAGAVGVFNAEHEFAAALLGEDVVEQADVGGADVRVAGGRRCDANADGRRSSRCEVSHEQGQNSMVAGRGDRTGDPDGAQPKWMSGASDEEPSPSRVATRWQKNGRAA